MSDSWSWDETLFQGAAEHYDVGRLPYAPALSEAFADALALDGKGRLLDVGCGPGTVALRLAHLFDSVVGLDADADMLREAARLAGERGITNASWVKALAETLPGGLGKFRAITFAASFHWMERERVASAVSAMLDRGGAVVHVDNRHQDGVSPPPDSTYPGPPDDEIAARRRAYLGADRRAGQSIRNTSPGNEAAVFRAAGFTGPQVEVVSDGRILTRTLDEVVHSVLSSSQTAPHLFGENLGAFESDLRALLRRVSPAGLFCVQLPDNHLNVWRAA